MNVSVIKHPSLLILIAIVCTQCRPTYIKSSSKKEFKYLYINEFKLTYFRKLLLAGFNYSHAIDSIVNFDKSGFTEPLLSNEDYQFIDSLAHNANSIMMTDSSKSIGTVAEGAEGKHVLQFIIDKLENKWIEKTARRRYRHQHIRRKLRNFQTNV